MGLRDRLWRLKTRREKGNDFDQARAAAVATGRMEPYIRVLASEPVWIPNEHPRITPGAAENVLQGSHLVEPEHGNSVLRATTEPTGTALAIYSTNSRMLDATGSKDGRQLLASEIPETDWPLAIDAGLAGELTITADTLHRAAKLAAGNATADAITAIGGERLVAAAATEVHEQWGYGDEATEFGTGKQQTETEPIPVYKGYSATRVRLLGLSGRTWTVYYREDADAEEINDPGVFVVNPEVAGYLRDLLWEFRPRVRQGDESS